MNDKMKRTYRRPSVTIVDIEPKRIICTSEFLNSCGAANGIMYGGVDKGGDVEVASRSFSLWEEDD
jgi:hypothetical protein